MAVGHPPGDGEGGGGKAARAQDELREMVVRKLEECCGLLLHRASSATRGVLVPCTDSPLSASPPLRTHPPSSLTPQDRTYRDPDWILGSAALPTPHRPTGKAGTRLVPASHKAGGRICARASELHQEGSARAGSIAHPAGQTRPSPIFSSRLLVFRFQ